MTLNNFAYLYELSGYPLQCSVCSPFFKEKLVSVLFILIFRRSAYVYSSYDSFVRCINHHYLEYVAWLSLLNFVPLMKWGSQCYGPFLLWLVFLPVLFTKHLCPRSWRYSLLDALLLYLSHLALYPTQINFCLWCKVQCFPKWIYLINPALCMVMNIPSLLNVIIRWPYTWKSIFGFSFPFHYSVYSWTNSTLSLQL